mmetsp:Transcript_9194/g.12402  ORF Transcript_9194/g.12402 Transcript_9194/m.12402 type:complete len:214 (+) Transcript_9194:47-688(+)
MPSNSQKCTHLFVIHAVGASDTTPSYHRGPSKVRGVSIPQEYKLARLIDDIEHNFPSWKESTPACKWDGVKCDEQSQIIHLKWGGRDLEGQLNWIYMPLLLQSLELWRNQLTGEVPFDSLPPTLESLVLHDNEFNGNPNFLHLPPPLKALNIRYNRFKGLVAFFSLPSSLRRLDLRGNIYLEGTLDVKGLQEHLCYDVRDTHITVDDEPLYRI